MTWRRGNFSALLLTLCVAKPLEDNQPATITNFRTNSQVSDGFLRLNFHVMSGQTNNMTTTDLQYEKLSVQKQVCWALIGICIL